MIWSKSASRGRAPSIPAGRRVYAVGDIHGRLDLLDAMLDLIDADLKAQPAAQPQLIFLGDYVDRGAQSAGVIHRLVEVMETYNAICLRGNHEVLFSSFLDQPASFSGWRTVGGLATLSSYGISVPPSPSPTEMEAMAADLAARMPQSHHVFLNNRPYKKVCGDYLFVHAGVRPRQPLARQLEEDILWIRDDFLLSDDPFEKFVVHGHTPVDAPDVRRHRINIDTGAFATNRLSCVVLEGQRRRFIQT